VSSNWQLISQGENICAQISYEVAEVTRKFSPKFWFGISFHALKFSFLPEFLCLPFFFDLTRFLTVAVLPFASSILGLSILRKKPNTPSSLIFWATSTDDLVPKGLPGPQPRSQVLSSSSPLERGCLVLRVFSTFQNGGRFQQSHKRRLNARFSKSEPHRRYRR